MSDLTLDDLTIQDRDQFGNLIGGFRYAEFSDLIAVLVSEGGTIEEATEAMYARGKGSLHALVDQPGRYLVWRIPPKV